MYEIRWTFPKIRVLFSIETHGLGGTPPAPAVSPVATPACAALEVHPPLNWPREMSESWVLRIADTMILIEVEGNELNLPCFNGDYLNLPCLNWIN